MTDNQENTDTGDASPSGRPTLPLRPPCDRLPCHKTSVCSRSYFVVVMVFFHVYIINVIALLFYVHYSSGQEDASPSGDAPSGGGQHQRSEARRPQPSKPDLVRDVSLTRIEGIRVGDVTMSLFCIFISSAACKASKIADLYFRWDMSRRCLLCQEKCMRWRLWAWNPCCLVRKINTNGSF